MPDIVSGTILNIRHINWGCLFQLFEVYEENGELIITKDGDVEGCEEDEFITANVIEEDIEETFSWALIVEQVI